MSSLMFVVPAHGRFDLTRICLRVLRNACANLEEHGIQADAIVVADDDNLDTAREFGFGWVERDNRFLGRRFNDGIQLAADVEYNRHPADYVVPCGSDDWVDWRCFLDLPNQDTMVGFQHLAVMSEDGTELTVRTLNYRGGAGIRIWPRDLLSRLGFRPADEDRRRGIDTSILVNVSRAWGYRYYIEHRHVHDLQLVDWKSPDVQLNTSVSLAGFKGRPVQDPYSSLLERYPRWAVDEMRMLYLDRQQVAA